VPATAVLSGVKARSARGAQGLLQLRHRQSVTVPFGVHADMVDVCSYSGMEVGKQQGGEPIYTRLPRLSGRAILPIPHHCLAFG
jgi:hypothetical protein